MIDRSFGLLTVFLALFFVGGIVLSAPTDLPVEQPIPFNHAVHADMDIACGECHFLCDRNRDEDGYLECDRCEQSEWIFCDEHLACPDHKLPGLPSVAICASCHEGDDPDEPGKHALMTFVETGAPIPWKRVTRLSESNVFFSHRRHALLGQILCSDCHGDVGAMEQPPTRPAVELGMDWCMDCHHEQGQSEGCVACHR